MLTLHTPELSDSDDDFNFAYDTALAQYVETANMNTANMDTVIMDAAGYEANFDPPNDNQSAAEFGAARDIRTDNHQLQSPPIVDKQMLPPAIDGIGYHTREDLQDAINAFAGNQGYAVTIRRTAKKGRKITFGCCHGRAKDKPGGGRKRLPEGAVHRNRGKRQFGCEATMTGKLCPDGLWRLTAVSGHQHNHPPTHRPQDYPVLRRLTVATEESVVHMHQSGVTPAAIISTVRKSNPSTNICQQSVYNAVGKAKQIDLNGKTPLQRLLEDLEQDRWAYRLKRNEAGDLSSLFFTHKTSLKWARTYPTSILMDCTYKTNRFKMPLLHVVGMTSTNQTFSIGFCFMTAEDEVGYSWAIRALVDCVYKGYQLPSVIATDREKALMNVLETVIPSAKLLLCRWHIFKNLAANLKSVVGDDDRWAALERDFWKVVGAATEEAFRIEWARFLTTWEEIPRITSYITEEWVGPYKERFITCWTNVVPHLGNLNTSRVEGAHHMLKSYILTSTKTLLEVVRAVERCLTNRDDELEKLLTKNQTTIYPSTNHPIFDSVRMMVSTFALDLAAEGLADCMMPCGQRPAAECSQTFAVWKGVPCRHHMMRLLISGGVLAVNDFHKHWRLKRLLPIVEEFDAVTGIELEETQEESAEDRNGQADLGAPPLWSALSPSQQAEILELLARPVSDPVVRRTKGRPQGAKGKKHSKAATSTQRDPSLFEHAARPKINCSACKAAGRPSEGHRKNSPKCPSLAGPSCSTF